MTLKWWLHAGKKWQRRRYVGRRERAKMPAAGTRILILTSPLTVQCLSTETSHRQPVLPQPPLHLPVRAFGVGV